MYNGLPIVTNKITIEEQEGVPHHLLGFIGLDEEPWRVGMFKKKANQVINEIRSRGRLPILVGGTHYYTQSLLFESSIIEGQDDSYSNTEHDLSNQDISKRFPILDGPTEDMINLLREVDPIMADRWHPKDTRKIRRSLEIFLTTGRKASDMYAEQKERKPLSPLDIEDMNRTTMYSPLLFWVHAESEILKKRLDGRVENMVRAGLLDEVKSMYSFLHEKALSNTAIDRTSGIWVSIGFKEFEQYLEALESGSISEKELSTLFELCIEHTQAATRQYAKRQVRWIRLKLIPALKEENVFDKLYLLDGSDISKWTDAVSKPAIEITASFLNGNELKAPHDLSSVAEEILTPIADGLDEKPDVWFREECELCNITTVTNHQWQQHLKSRRHRALIKKKQRTEERGRYDQQSGYSSPAKSDP
jgi:tRNA dimethylallyltransferase